MPSVAVPRTIKLECLVLKNHFIELYHSLPEGYTMEHLLKGKAQYV